MTRKELKRAIREHEPYSFEEWLARYEGTPKEDQCRKLWCAGSHK